MKRSIAVVIAALVIVGEGRASAQEVTAGPGTVEITAIPGGGTFFTSRHNAPSFGNYTLGGALTYNINPIVGVEGEVSGAFGVSQDLAFGGITTNQKSPNTLNYATNVVVSAPTHSSVVPYVAGGVGGLTMYERAGLGINGTQTFLTGNVGGGVKWYAPNGHGGCAAITDSQRCAARMTRHRSSVATRATATVCTAASSSTSFGKNDRDRLTVAPSEAPVSALFSCHHVSRPRTYRRAPS